MILETALFDPFNQSTSINVNAADGESVLSSRWEKEELRAEIVHLLIDAARRGCPRRLLERASRLEASSGTRATIESQIPLAFQPSHYERWGRHYLISLPLSIEHRRRTNFRDACLSDFGKDIQDRDSLFHTISEEAEMCFACTPPPPPSRCKTQTAQTSQPTRLPDEFMRGGGCFSGDCSVTVADPSFTDESGTASHNVTTKPIRYVTKGDFVKMTSGVFLEVECVVLSLRQTSEPMIQIGGAVLTPWHPFCLGTRWFFPSICSANCKLNPTWSEKHLDSLHIEECINKDAFVWNFVFKGREGHSLLVNGISCAILGHEIQDDEIVSHPFWGTQTIVDTLREIDSYEAGTVYFSR